MSWTEFCRMVSSWPSPARWAWAATRDADGAWVLAHFAVRAPAEATPRQARYRDAAIGVEQITPRTAARRLRAGIAAPKSSLGRRLEFSAPVGDVYSQWFVTKDEPMRANVNDWPELAVTVPGEIRAPFPAEPLQSPGQPLYSSWAAAVSELVFERAIEPTRLHQQPGGVVRLCDRRGRFGALRVTAGTAVVELESERESLAGWSVRASWRRDLASAAWESRDIVVESDDDVAIDIGAVPYEMTIVLVDRDGRTIDMRGWEAGAALPLDNLASLEKRVERWRQDGESREVEFKQALDKPPTRERFAETVAAFANGSGGVVLVGVDDRGEIAGYGRAKAADQIIQIISTNVADPPAVDIQSIDVEGRPVWVVQVAPSPRTARPHTVRGRIPVRAHATTRYATPQEVREMTAQPPEVPTLTSRRAGWL